MKRDGASIAEYELYKKFRLKFIGKVLRSRWRRSLAEFLLLEPLCFYKSIGVWVQSSSDGSLKVK